MGLVRSENRAGGGSGTMKGNAVGVPEGSFLVRDASRVDEELPERFKDAVPLRAPKLKSSLARTLVIGDVVNVLKNVIKLRLISFKR